MIDSISRAKPTEIIARVAQNRPPIAAQRQDGATHTVYDFTNMSRKEFDSLW